MSLYSDRHGIFTKHDPEEPDPTQYGRATLQLGIEPIQARSPQAKGRIERLLKTMQDLGTRQELARICALSSDKKTINSRVNSLMSKSKSTQRQKMLAQFEHQDYQRQQGIYKPTHHTSQI